MISPMTELAGDATDTGLSGALEKDLVQTFKLLSDATRLKILLYLVREGELHVTALCERLQQSQPAVSHHLALLRDSGLITPRRDGKHNFYSVKREHFHRVIGALFSTILNEPDEALQEFLLQRDADRMEP